MIQKIKNYAIIILILISLIGGVVSYITIKSNRNLRDNWSVSENNYKASNKKNLAYQISLEQMKLSSDSLDKILIEFKNKNKLKDSKIKSLMTIIESGGKSDTINLIDTIFVKDLKLDTIVGDQWIQSRLQLEYPSRIIITDSVLNIKSIAWSNRRETIDPPKKFFICRWFQRKQTVVEILIEDLNPYFKTKEFKYNTIIK